MARVFTLRCQVKLFFHVHVKLSLSIKREKEKRQKASFIPICVLCSV